MAWVEIVVQVQSLALEFLYAENVAKKRKKKKKKEDNHGLFRRANCDHKGSLEVGGGSRREREGCNNSGLKDGGRSL